MGSSGLQDQSAAFAPHTELAKSLLPHAIGGGGDSAHDLSHILRIWRNVQAISAEEGGSGSILTAATILHDCINLPKNAPNRASASRLSAEHARGLLQRLGWDVHLIDAVAHAIESHSFSANIPPQTVEARILQDADRLDALGYIGIARCFAVSGQLGRALYDPADPAAAQRDLDDTRYTLDHFSQKLMRLVDTFQTQTGQRIAAARHQTIVDFRAGFLAEISGPDT